MPRSLALPAALLAAALSGTTPALAAASLELYGTLESMGVIVTIAPADDPDGDAQAEVEYREQGASSYRDAFPPDRVASGRFVGSLFGLRPGTGHDVRVTLRDPDGGPLDGVVLTGSQSTRPEVVVPPPARTLYASPGGSGSACSQAAPCALAQAVSQAVAGDQVVLLAGVYRAGGLAPRTGTPGAPIVFRGVAAGAAVLDGADPATFVWIPQGGGVYRTTLSVAGPQVIADDQRLYPHASLADLQSLRYGLHGFYASGTDLYVRLPGDADPSGAFMEVARENSAFTLDDGINHVYFVDLVFRNYGRGSYPKAIYFNGGSDGLVRGSSFRHNGLGVGVKRASARLLIEDNEFSDSRFSWSWDAEKASGLLEPVAVQFFDPATGRGNVIRRNHIHDGFDGLGVAPDATAGSPTNETDVSENDVHHVGDDGVSVDGMASNVRIWGNRLHDVLVGVSLAPSYVGPSYVLRNLVYRTDTGNNQWPGSPFKFNSGSPGSGVLYLLHNTVDVVTASQDSLHVVNPGDWDKLVLRNNVLSATKLVISNTNTAQPIDLDYDCTYTTGSNFASWSGAGTFPTLAGFQAATGQEPNAVYGPPGFVAPAAGDYTLGSSSTCLDRALVLPGINDDFSGSGPDMGAIESGTTAPEPPDLLVSALSAPATGGAGYPLSLTESTRNQGAGPAAASTTRFYLSANKVLDAADVALGSRTVAGLGAGETSSATTAPTVPPGTPTGTYFIIASADDDEAVSETVETNNTRASAAVKIGPDLRVSGLAVPAKAGAGSTITVTDTTRNDGGGQAAASATKLYLSTNTSLDAADVLLGTRAVSVLDAGQASSGGTVVTLPSGTASGTYYVIAKADGNGVVAETNEGNNTRTAKIGIGPDLIVAVLTAPASAPAGSTITVNDTTKNQGGGGAGATTTRFYLSTNPGLDAGDAPLGSRSVPALAAGASSAGATTVILPAGTTGTRYLLAVADGASVVTETIETNNVKARAIAIQ